MKKILTLLLGIAVAIPALCQLPDTSQMQKGYRYFSPAPLNFEGGNYIDRITMKMYKVTDMLLNTGGVILYNAETDVQGGNKPATMSRALILQIPSGAFISDADKAQVEELIRKLVLPDTITQGPKPDVITDIDNVGGANVYTPGDWQHRANTSWLQAGNFFDATASYNTTVDATIETTFTGYKIQWFTEKHQSHGKAAVSIDDGEEVIVDLYDPTTQNNSRLVWASQELANGQHKIKIRVTGEKNEAATGTSIIHDYFKVHRKQ